MASSQHHLTIFIVLVGISLISVVSGRTLPKGCEGFCEDRGFCVIRDGEPTCLCYPEWQGRQCKTARPFSLENLITISHSEKVQARFGECAYVPNLCLNGGLCQFNGTDFSCACTFSHIGARCEIASPCIGYCLNGGYCNVTSEFKAECYCNGTGYQGARCEIMTTPPPTSAPNTTLSPLCTALKPYCNGADCTIVNGAPTCMCRPPSIPPYCDTPTTLATAAPTVPTPAPPVMTTAPIVIPPVVTTAPIVIPPGVTTAPIIIPPGVTTTLSASGAIPGVTCAANPCKNARPCYNNGNSYFCFCGNLYSGYNCEFLVGK